MSKEPNLWGGHALYMEIYIYIKYKSSFIAKKKNMFFGGDPYFWEAPHNLAPHLKRSSKGYLGFTIDVSPYVRHQRCLFNLFRWTEDEGGSSYHVGFGRILKTKKKHPDNSAGDLFGMVKCPFQRLSDLQLGDDRGHFEWPGLDVTIPEISSPCVLWTFLGGGWTQPKQGILLWGFLVSDLLRLQCKFQGRKPNWKKVFETYHLGTTHPHVEIFSYSGPPKNQHISFFFAGSSLRHLPQSRSCWNVWWSYHPNTPPPQKKWHGYRTWREHD